MADGIKNNCVVLLGTTAGDFKRKIEDQLSCNAAEIEVSRFKDGETKIFIPENIRDKDVYLVHRLGPPANDSMMQLALTLDALTKASAKRITVILPYMAYSRSDRRTEGREPIGAQVVARMIEEFGADRIVVLDLHSEQTQGFFRKPVDNIYGTHVLMPEVIRHLREHGIDPGKVKVVSPDAGGTKRARAVAISLGCEMVMIDKKRIRANEIESMQLVGEVRGDFCLMVDDIVDTAGTLVRGAALLKECGAVDVIAVCTHPLLSGDAQERIESSPISKFFVTDSVGVVDQKSPKIEVIHLGSFLGEVIRKISNGESLLELRHQGVQQIFH